MNIYKHLESKYFFSDELTSQLLKKLVKLKNISFVYMHNHKNNNIYKIKNLCKKNKIKFYISNNLSLYYKTKADGFHISSSYKNTIIKYTKPRKILGTCHNQKEYFQKIRQNCEILFLSPLFQNPKFSINKYLGATKFNLLKLRWKLKIMPLGGIFPSNMQKLRILGTNGFGFNRLIKKPF